MNYTTLDYLPDLEDSYKNSAIQLTFTPYISTSSYIPWDTQAKYSTTQSRALLDSTFTIDLTEGNTYDITSSSYFDPFLLRLYDEFGNTIETDDGSGSYGYDYIWDFVAPYSGEYYIGASWDQGLYSKYVSVGVYGHDLEPEVPEVPVENNTSNDDSKSGSSSDDSKSGSSSDDSKAGDSSVLTGGRGIGQNIMGDLNSNLDTLYYFNHAFGDVDISIEDPLLGRRTVNFQEGEDTILQIERLSFTDTKVALDLDHDDNAGAALAVLYAAFDELPDADNFGYWINESDQISTSTMVGSRIENMADLMLDYYAPDGVSNEDLVNLLYNNILDKEPTELETATFVDIINNGTYTQASFLAMAAETDLNQNQYVELVGQGLAYNEYDSKAG